MAERTGEIMRDEKDKVGQHPYDSWKAVTEADFVTLFIKTWFAFVSTLRELYPHSKPYYEASGDSPFVEAYRREFVNKFYFLCPLTPSVEQSILSTYKAGLQIISEKYPRFLIKDFYRFNTSYSDKFEESYTSTGGYSGRLSLSIKCSTGSSVKIALCNTDKKFLEKTNEKTVLLERKFNYDSIAEKFIEELELSPRPVEESEPIAFFYNTLFKEIANELSDVLDRKQNAIPDKGFSQVKKVYTVVQSFCRRAIDTIRVSCLDAAVGESHKLLSQIPVSDFLQSYGGLTLSDKQNAYLWFVSFVYRLRNALFHEIIDPLDTSWQHLFKNAYLVLKQVVDANISRMKTVRLLLELAPLIYEKDFRDAPPPEIPIGEYEADFVYDAVELVYYNQSGAKIHISSKITCNNISYQVKCFVRWDETLKLSKVKNVEISRFD